ncbi:MAG: signal peptidase I [Clostridia bacterium]|nr:signal peptidase I [Clostridia bacterium]
MDEQLNNAPLSEEDSEKALKEKTSDSFNLGREILEWVYTIAIALAITFIVKYFVFDVVRVDGPSMIPTLQNNDKLIVTKLGYKPKAGDIIILDSAYSKRHEYIESVEQAQGHEMTLFDKISFKLNTPSYLKERYYVKRIIALPGQTIDLDSEGHVLIDGQILNEPYYQGVTKPIDSKVSFPITVEEGKVFVMGDNRGVSKDSRSSELGQVPYEAILGKAEFRIWPLNSISVLK